MGVSKPSISKTTVRKIVNSVKPAVNLVRGVLKRNTPNYETKWRSDTRYKAFAGNAPGNDPSRALPFIRDKRIKANLAAADKSKYRVKIQWIDGKSYMFIPGTRPTHLSDWAKNFADWKLPGRVPGYIESKYYDSIARIYKPDVVIGHSRGAYIASRMKYGKGNNNVRYVGVDGAMRLSKKDERNMFNIAYKEPIDKWLGRGGKNNYYVPYKWWKDSFHKVYV